MWLLVIVIALPVLVALWVGWKGRRRNRYDDDAPGAAKANAEAERIRSQAYNQPPLPPGGNSASAGF